VQLLAGTLARAVLGLEKAGVPQVDIAPWTLLYPAAAAAQDAHVLHARLKITNVGLCLTNHVARGARWAGGAVAAAGGAGCPRAPRLTRPSSSAAAASQRQSNSPLSCDPPARACVRVAACSPISPLADRRCDSSPLARRAERRVGDLDARLRASPPARRRAGAARGGGGAVRGRAVAARVGERPPRRRQPAQRRGRSRDSSRPLPPPLLLLASFHLVFSSFSCATTTFLIWQAGARPQLADFLRQPWLQPRPAADAAAAAAETAECRLLADAHARLRDWYTRFLGQDMRGFLKAMAPQEPAPGAPPVKQKAGGA